MYILKGCIIFITFLQYGGMMADSIEVTIKNLTDRDLIMFQYGLNWAKGIDDRRGWVQAAEHGESPTLGPEYLRIQQSFKDKKDAYIDHLPEFLDGHMFAVVDLLLWNNQQMIELMQKMVLELKKGNE
jgi:hypothetical protein